MLHCGLLGRSLPHSYSPAIHKELADYEYRLYEKEPEELEDFLRRGEFDGLNVTIPYKKTVMPYCSALSDTAKAIGSVNTLVRRADGTLYGDNTDAFGFGTMITQSGIVPAGKKALVFGSGGAGVTAVAVLREMGAEVVVISRGGEDNYENLWRHRDAALLVNTTPLGMYPAVGVSPVAVREFPHCCGVLDVVYNPARTALLLQAEELGLPHSGGLTMLVAQAKRSSELFTGEKLPENEIPRITKMLAREMQNIILIGMPGCGKSSVGKALAKALGRKFADCDRLVEKTAGKSIPQIFAEEGEEAFRARETAALAELGKQSGLVLATGGGCVTRAENYPLLHQNGTIIWLQRPLAALPTAGRPLSQQMGAEALYEARRPLYEHFADRTVMSTGRVDKTAEKILEALQ